MINARMWIVICLSGLVVASADGPRLAAQEEASNGTPLRWQLAAGERWNVSFTQSTTTIATVGKNAVKMKVEQGAELKWVVESIDEAGNMRIEQTLSRLTMKMSKTDGSEAVEFDSASEERPRGAAREIADSAGPLVGTKVLFTLSPRGEVVAVELPQETQDVVKRIQDRSKAAALFTPEGMSEVLKQVMPLLPAEPVNLEETWQAQSQKSLPSGKLTQTTSFIYQGADETAGGLHKIAVAGEVQFAPAEDAPSRLTLKQHQLTGSLWYNPQDAAMARGSIQQNLVTESPYRNESITTRLTTDLNFEFQRLSE